MNNTLATKGGVVDVLPAKPDSSLPKILLVDDQPARLLTYEAVLEGVGVSCTRALSGTEALHKLLLEEFAVIVLDVQMPDLDGFETARHIREHPRFEKTPIIFVTGVNISELDRLRGYEVGAIDYIPLPIVPEIFRSKIALLVELYTRRTELKNLNRELEAARARLEDEKNDAIGELHRYESEANGRRFRNLLVPVGDNTVLASGVDITESANADLAAMRPSAAPKHGEWITALLENMKEEVYFTAPDGRYTYANPAAIREFGRTSLAGTTVSKAIEGLEVFRADGTLRSLEEAPPLRALKGEIIRDEDQVVRIPRTGELRHRQVSAAPARNDAGDIVGSVAVVRDVTYRRRIEREHVLREVQTAALLRLADRFRLLTDPADLAFAAAEVLGETLAVSRCGYGTIDHAAETITIERDWNAPGIRSLAGVLHFRDYGTYIDELKRGETVVCADAARDSRTAATAGALRSIQVQSFVNMPITEHEGTVALLYLNHAQPREWPEEELAFIRDIAERTRVAVERRRHERALAADLECMGRLRDLSAKLISEEDPDVLFGQVLATATYIASADCGSIQLYDPIARELVLAGARGFDATVLARFRRTGAAMGSSCGMALATRRRVFIGLDPTDGPDPDGTRACLRSLGLRCAQSTPLVSRAGKLLGMLSTHWREKRSISEREYRFLDLLARQAADLIERQEVDRAMREADRRKDEFIAMLSHELRNPLVPIRNGISMLKHAPDPDGMLARIQPMMERQMAHTVRLVDDLLDVSRITSGRIELVRAPATIESIVTGAVDAHRDQIEAGGFEFVLRIDEPARAIHVDGARLTQVVSNLLNNAVKYSHRGGRIELDARVQEAPLHPVPQLLVTVQDAGIGIRPEELHRIFDLFASAPAAPDAHLSLSGLGVGLALAKKIVELHGGSLQACSEGIGRGSAFTMRIPVATPGLAESSVSRVDAVAPMSGDVLVVDDNVDGANSIAMLLETLGLQARAVYDGHAALAAIRERQPSAVLLDIDMPVVDGFEVCRHLRGLYGGAIRVIALTGWGQDADKRRAMEAGFDLHLTKPIEPEALEGALRTLTNQREH